VLSVALTAIFVSRSPSSPATMKEGPIPLAVLPFRTLGVLPDSAIVTVGVPDAIITRLAGVPQFRLRPTSTILRFAEGSPEPREAGKVLSVDYLLTGTVQPAGDRLRVSVQLLRTGDGSRLWGAHYDLARQDLFRLQDSIRRTSQ
jgi:TolB-like protein